MFLRTLVLAVAALGPATAAAEPVAVSVVAGPDITAHTRQGFVGVTLDWWGSTGGCHNCGGGWRNASVTALNLQSSRLQTLAKALAPATLRLGGSLDKDVQYWLPTAGAGASALAHALSRAPGGGGGERDMPPPPAACAAGSSTPNMCLNASRWDEINQFCAETGLQLAMGLSLNMSQNEALIRYTKQQGYPILAYEIPEEYTPGTPPFAAALLPR